MLKIPIGMNFAARDENDPILAVEPETSSKKENPMKTECPQLKRIALPDLKDPAVIREALDQARADGDLEMYSEFLQIQRENRQLRFEANMLAEVREILEARQKPRRRTNPRRTR